MRSTKEIRTLLTIAAAISVYSPICFATPTLQLNIAGGTYNYATQTVVAPTNTSSNVFKLFAYLVEDAHRGDLASDVYYVSMAIGPQLSTPQDLGSFVFNGQTVNVSSGMTYGTPPLEGSDAAKDHGDLPSHGVFPTYFAEWAFTFNPSMVTQEFNTEDHPDYNPTLRPVVDRPMFYQEFAVDVSDLNPAYTVHFDLYSKQQLLKNVTYFTHNPAAYVPSTPESCTNGSTSYPNCTVTTTATTSFPSSYRPAYMSCKQGNQSGPYCIDNKGNPNPGDVISHPESCKNGSTTYPSCSLTTTTSTNNRSAYVAAAAEHCTNGSRSYPDCTTTSIGFVPSGQYDIKSFAPFSHDAEGGYHDVGSSEDDEDPAGYSVPETSSALLVFVGLAAVGAAKKRQSSARK